jgi:hypothetical protein
MILRAGFSAGVCACSVGCGGCVCGCAGVARGAVFRKSATSRKDSLGFVSGDGAGVLPKKSPRNSKLLLLLGSASGGVAMVFLRVNLPLTLGCFFQAGSPFVGFLVSILAVGVFLSVSVRISLSSPR